MLGAVPTVDPQLSGDFATLMGWADQRRRLKVRTNAETPRRRARRAPVRRRGHRPVPHRAHVLRRSAPGRDARDDPRRRRRRPARGARQDPADAARRLRRAVRDHGRPADHDPPARPAAARVPAARARGDRGGRAQPRASMPRHLRRRASELRETNPMLGLRGCRVGVLFPEIYEMQARAIFEARRRGGAGRAARRWCPRSWCRWSAPRASSS